MVIKSQLRVVLEKEPWRMDAVEARIYTKNMEFVDEALLTPNKGITVDVVPGVYVIEARRPAGRPFFVTTEVPVEGKHVQLPVEKDETAQLVQSATHLQELTKSIDASLDVWVRLWDPRHDDYIPLSPDNSLEGVHVYIEQDHLSFELSSESIDWQPVLILEVGREDIKRRWFSLPMFRDKTKVVLTGAALTQKGRIGSPFISTPTQRLQAILQLLEDPAPGAPEELWSALSKQRILEDDEFLLQGAEDYLREKVHDPLAAAAGALYLVRFEMFDKMHGWARNLADWFPWLADGAAAWAAQLLRDVEVTTRVQKWRIAKTMDGVWENHYGNFEDVWCAAEAWLIHAVVVGPPVFSESLKQLAFGFDAVARYFSANDRQPSQEFLESYLELQRWASDLRSGLLVSASGLYDPWAQEDVNVPKGATILKVDRRSQLILDWG